MDGNPAVAGAVDEVRRLLDQWLRAVRAGDVEAIFACYAADIVAFDAIQQLQFKGVDAYRTHWKACLEACGSMLFEMHETEIAAAGDVGFAHYLARCGGTGPDGTVRTGWMRVTVCCRRIDGRWQVVHEHFSAPFDPETLKALFDRQP